MWCNLTIVLCWSYWQYYPSWVSNIISFYFSLFLFYKIPFYSTTQRDSFTDNSTQDFLLTPSYKVLSSWTPFPKNSPSLLPDSQDSVNTFCLVSLVTPLILLSVVSLPSLVWDVFRTSWFLKEEIGLPWPFTFLLVKYKVLLKRGYHTCLCSAYRLLHHVILYYEQDLDGNRLFKFPRFRPNSSTFWSYLSSLTLSPVLCDLIHRFVLLGSSRTRNIWYNTWNLKWH